MRPVTTEIDAREAQGRSRPGARATKVRKAHLRRLTLEGLEARALLATLPPLTVTATAPIQGGYNTTDNQLSESSPVLAVNPNNPLQVVSVNAQRNPNTNPLSYSYEIRVSSDGGSTWPAATAIGTASDFTSTAAPPPRFRPSGAPSVAWDLNNNFYVLNVENNGSNSGGQLILRQFDAGAGLVRSDVLNSWNQVQLPTTTPPTTAFDRPGILEAVMAIDNGPTSYTDPDTGLTQTNPYSGRIHVALLRDTPTAPNYTGPWNRYTVEVGTVNAARDGFTGLRTISDGNFGDLGPYSSPQIVVSGNNATRDRFGNVDPNVRLAGGTVTVLFTDQRSSRDATPPQDVIIAYRGEPTANGGYTNENLSFVAATAVRRGVPTGNNSLAVNAAGSRGVGPQVAMAVDNSLGAFSPYQGRIYAAYVDRFDNTRFGAFFDQNDADNTDVILIYSDDGGAVWRYRDGTPTTTQFGPGGVEFPGAPYNSVLNDDRAREDGFSGAVTVADLGETAARYRGRPQFLPQLAVDNSTGTLVASYLDARRDAARARVQTSVTASIDGGRTFNASTFANTANIAFDVARQSSVNLGPVPENYSGANPNNETDLAIGSQIGLAALNGRFYASWIGNGNGGSTGNTRYTTTVGAGVFASGPRVISSTMGPVAPGASFSSFDVEFDRPVPSGSAPGAFSVGDVQVFYNGPNANPVGLDPDVLENDPIAVASVQPLDAGPFGATRFRVNLASAQTRVGTYRYNIGRNAGDASSVSDRIRLARPFDAGAAGRTSTLGNTMDQNADAFQNAANFDVYANPRPVNGVPGVAPFDLMTVPIIVAGPSILSTSVPNGRGSDNMVPDGTVSSLTVTFDRPMQTATFTPADIQRIVGPLGVINAPTLIQATAALNATGLGQTIPDASGTPLVSTLTIPSTGRTFTIADLEVRVSIQHPSVSELTVALVRPGPDGQFGTADDIRVRLIDRPALAATNRTNMVNTTFDDQAGLDFTQGIAPFTNVYRPAPGQALSAFNGQVLDGQWRLEVTDNTRSNVGTLGAWALVATPVISVTPVNPSGGSATQFRIDFPQQTVNGTYSVVLGPNILSTLGQALDTNRNAGLDRLRGSVVVPNRQVNYQSPSVPINIGAGQTVTSRLVINDDFVVQPSLVVNGVSQGGAQLGLNLTFPDVSFLEATLTRVADNTIIPLFTSPGNIPGNRANFTNTVLDDDALTSIQDNVAQAPFFGRFAPQSSLDNGLTDKSSRGEYILTIRNRSTTLTGQLTAWSLNFATGASSSGLGETNADQASASFRIFNMDPAQAVSTNTWTAVGPASIFSGGQGFTGAGRMTGLAVDPSDPSGNTVYVGGASGGVWKTTNFLTQDPIGPTYVPLTSLGPNSSQNIGGIAVFGRNNDPRQSIILVATGEGDTLTGGVGLLRSLDGGATWQVLDSLVNTDAAGNLLPIANRGREFVGNTSFKVVFDPRPGRFGAIAYVAFSGPRGGIYRTLDSGNTWQLVRGGQATDVVLDPLSGPVDAITNPFGNLLTVYGAFRGEGVYLSPNQGNNWQLMTGGVGKPLVQNANAAPTVPTTVNNLGVNPNGARGRIVLGKPELLGDTLRDQLYQGWLYAFVATADGGIDGLYLTKDFGQNWTRVRYPSLGVAANQVLQSVPTNDQSQADLNLAGSVPGTRQGNYNIAITVDPNDPNIVYLGGQALTSLIRIDITKLSDPHSLFTGDDRGDGGQRRSYTTSPVTLTPQDQGIGSVAQPAFNPINQPQINFYRNPDSPFQADSTIYTNRVASFANDGSGATWIPFLNTDSVGGTANAFFGGADIHRMLAVRDPLTGKTRLLVANDHGIYTAVDRGDAGLVRSLGIADTNDANGSLPLVWGGRNGNLQITQLYYGTAQPDQGAANAGGYLFGGQAQDDGFPRSVAGLLDRTSGNYGNIRHVNSARGDGTGIVADPTGTGTTYQYDWPCCGGNVTDFFRVNGIGRTFGLVQQSGSGDVPDPQWPNLGGSNFAVNPIAGGPTNGQVIISSQAGRIFGTVNAGRNWFVIGEPSALDGTYAPALAYGAPDPTAPDGGFATNNFLYAGTSGGRIFVTRVGGGAAGTQWVNISAGLDGSPVRMIVTNPTRGSGEAYAVTAGGVFWMRDSRVANATWTNITGNLFSLTNQPFDRPVDVEQALRFINAIQADYRYAIPVTPTDPNSATFPVLYVAGQGGVFRSVDNGATWALFPDITFNRTPRPGGYLPSAEVTDLDLALGRINPTNGRPIEGTANGGTPNVLLASTYGNGQFAIRLAPLVFDSTVRFSTSRPTSSGSTAGTDPTTGLPLVTVTNPVIDGSSQTSAYGNLVTIRILDLTGVDVNDPAAVAAARVIGQGQTDAFGRLVTRDGSGQFVQGVQVNANAFTTNGRKRIGIVAIDASGTVGNVVLREFIRNVTGGAVDQPPAAPSQLALLAADDTFEPGDGITSNNRPRFTGRAQANVQVFLVATPTSAQPNPPFASITISPSVTTDASGNFTVQVGPNALPDGVYFVRAVASNTAGESPASTAFVRLQVLRTGPTTAPTLAIRPQDDFGVKGDFVTNIRRPVFDVTTTTDVRAVQLIRTTDGAVLATAVSPSPTVPARSFNIQLPSDLSNGRLDVQVRALDAAGNVGPLSGTYSVTIITNQGDYTGDGYADLAIYRASERNFYLGGVNATYGGWPPVGSVPMQGDFDGDGREDLAVYQPSSGLWIIARSLRGAQVLTYGLANVDIPAAADFDGDGVTDVAVFRPTTGQWFVLGSSGVPDPRFNTPPVFGGPGDIPAPGDYDGDRRADIALYRPSTGQYFVVRSIDARLELYTFPNPTPADFAHQTDIDGDGRTDMVVYGTVPGQPGQRQFSIVPSSLGFGTRFDVPYGIAGDVPVTRDYDADGRADLGIFRPSNALWIISRTTFGTLVVPFAQPNDIAVPGPYSYKLSAVNLTGGTGGARALAAPLGGLASSGGTGGAVSALSAAASDASLSTGVVLAAATVDQGGTAATTTGAATTTPAPSSVSIRQRRAILVGRDDQPSGPLARRKARQEAAAKLRAARLAQIQAQRPNRPAGQP